MGRDRRLPAPRGTTGSGFRLWERSSYERLRWELRRAHGALLRVHTGRERLLDQLRLFARAESIVGYHGGAFAALAFSRRACVHEVSTFARVGSVDPRDMWRSNREPLLAHAPLLSWHVHLLPLSQMLQVWSRTSRRDQNRWHSKHGSGRDPTTTSRVDLDCRGMANHLSPPSDSHREGKSAQLLLAQRDLDVAVGAGRWADPAQVRPTVRRAGWRARAEHRGVLARGAVGGAARALPLAARAAAGPGQPGDLWQHVRSAQRDRGVLISVAPGVHSHKKS